MTGRRTTADLGAERVVEVLVIVVVHKRLAGEHEEAPLRHVVHELDLANAVLSTPLRGAGLLGKVPRLIRDEHLAGVGRPAEATRPAERTKGGVNMDSKRVGSGSGSGSGSGCEE